MGSTNHCRLTLSTEPEWRPLYSYTYVRAYVVECVYLFACLWLPLICHGKRWWYVSITVYIGSAIETISCTNNNSSVGFALLKAVLQHGRTQMTETSEILKAWNNYYLTNLKFWHNFTDCNFLFGWLLRKQRSTSLSFSRFGQWLTTEINYDYYGWMASVASGFTV